MFLNNKYYFSYDISYHFNGVFNIYTKKVIQLVFMKISLKHFFFGDNIQSLNINISYVLKMSIVFYT